jgi:uncharacterized protein involved in exopolysaccharide biosynthesis
MNDSFDAIRYIGYLRERLRPIVASALGAALIALAVSLFMPREYTATARVIIEPPASMDPRSSITVSPIYLESLKT